MRSNQTSGELFERAKKVAPGGVHSPVRSFKGMDCSPIFFKSAQGAYLTSVEDEKYIDFCMSFGPLILGHRDFEVEEAVLEMIHKAWTFGACEPYSLELGEWIQNELPWIERLRFVSSGTEAVMSALRVARAATGRNKILKFEGCYHGHADSMLVKAGSGLAGEAQSSSAGVSADTSSHTLVCQLGDAQNLETIFLEYGSQIAAVIIEPLPANYGLLIQSQLFLKQISSLCEKNGSLLIFDEVISGFRVGLGGMVERTGIRADLVTYGKVIGGGFPVGCYGGKKELMDRVAPLGDVYQAGTLSANPIGMRAGLVTLQKMKRIDGWKLLEKRTSNFVEQLKLGFNKHGIPLEVTSHSSIFWIHSTVATQRQSLFKKLFQKALDHRVYLAPNAYEVGFLSVAHREDILDEAAQLIIKAANNY